MIFAVYQQHEAALLRLDPGFAKRSSVIRLSDFTGEQLHAIFQRLVKTKNYTITEEASQLIRAYCIRLYDTRSEDSGNANQMGNLLREILKTHRQRVAGENIRVDQPGYWDLTRADLPRDILRLVANADSELEIERLKQLRETMENDRVGCEDVKVVLRQRINTMIYNLRYPNRRHTVEPGHFFFIGHAGTGKTTAAAFMAKYMAEMGLIRDGELYKVTASDLIAGYVGQTGPRTREALMQGRDRVMLIDEAYALTDKESGGGSSSFKDDAITELVSFLDDEGLRKITCVIFAGYEHDMDGIYKRNEGLRSRVTELRFPDFTPAQSETVFISMAAREHYTLEAGAEESLREVLAALHAQPRFANGRTVRRLFELVERRAEDRVMNNEYPPDDERVSLLMREDFPPVDSETVRQLNTSD